MVLLVILLTVKLYARINICNGIIQSHFDYACSALYPNLNKNLKANCNNTNKCIEKMILSSTRQQKLHWNKGNSANELASCFQKI